MNQIEVKNDIIALAEWLNTTSGKYAYSWEKASLDDLTADIFGFNALQVGFPEINTLSANRMTNRWVTNSIPNCYKKCSRQLDVVHDFTDLPFASQSLDLVVLPHVLEFSSRPHKVLREIERVLIPEGQVIISGFNPVSTWGLRQIFGKISNKYFLPSNGEFISVPRLKDWLKLLNMEINRGQYGCYLPPFTSKKWMKRYSFLEKAGRRWWPFLGAIYIIQAIKRVNSLKLVGPVWKNKSSKVQRVFPAANRLRYPKIKK
mgnify:CR=1 FL=1